VGTDRIGTECELKDQSVLSLPSSTQVASVERDDSGCTLP
jgi:hypothetical protein